MGVDKKSEGLDEKHVGLEEAVSASRCISLRSP